MHDVLYESSTTFFRVVLEYTYLASMCIICILWIVVSTLCAAVGGARLSAISAVSG